MKRVAKYVQGDVFLEPIGKLPGGLKVVVRNNGQAVLAEGEATGHAHTIESMDAILHEDKNKELYLMANKEVSLVHQEHKPITISPGTYKVGIVREYDYFLEEARKVVD